MDRRPPWNLTRTTQEAEEADKTLASQDLNPAPTFRARRLAEDGAALKSWTAGCGFEWLRGKDPDDKSPKPRAAGRVLSRRYRGVRRFQVA